MGDIWHRMRDQNVAIVAWAYDHPFYAIVSWLGVVGLVMLINRGLRRWG